VIEAPRGTLFHHYQVDDQGLLPPAAVGEIRAWLDLLATDTDARAGVVKQTLDGAIRNVARRSYDLADAGALQAETAGRLRDDVERAYREALDRVDVV